MLARADVVYVVFNKNVLCCLCYQHCSCSLAFVYSVWNIYPYSVVITGFLLDE